jgi:hypothetical protein
MVLRLSWQPLDLRWMHAGALSELQQAWLRALARHAGAAVEALVVALRGGVTEPDDAELAAVEARIVAVHAARFGTGDSV